jgi:hypothetical protein
MSININLIFDAAALAAPASFRAGIQQAANLLAMTITDAITVNLKIDYSGTGGGASAGPDNGVFESYSLIRSDLINHATLGDTTFNALPSGSSIQGQTNVDVWNAQLKLFGLLSPNDTTTDDGHATFATDINPNLLVGVALHELTHALGRIPHGTQPDIFDLFRYTGPGTLLFQGGATAPAAYFSVDGGHTKLADYGQTSDASDFLNTGVQGPNDPFDEFYGSKTLQKLTAVDVQQLDALGFHVAPVSSSSGAQVVNDLNGDGHSDLLWQAADGTPAAWLVNGTSLVAGANIGFNPGATWHTKGLGDFNGDGKADILWQNDDGTPAVWLMNGLSVSSGANVGFNPGPAWHVIAAADFNGDGNADILWQNADGTPAIWLMNGTSLIAGASLFNPGPSWHVIGAGDFNGDGKADILWQNSNGQAAIWLMNGLTLVSGANAGINLGPAWQIQAAGDFNGDGKADILLQNSNGQPAIWQMNGQNVVAISNVGFNPGAAWQIHAAADFNGDGKADIEWQNTDGTPAVWLMNGFNVVSGANVGFDPGANWHLTPGHDVLA